jgi:dephospho-CoA kinase
LHSAAELAIQPAAHDNLLMIIIGLIGRIAAGKSTVARRFAARGGHVIDADRIAHEVLQESDVVRQIAIHFGSDVLDADGRIRRRAVAERVFGSTPGHAQALEWLESLVHPRVRSRIDAELAAIESHAGGRTPPESGTVVVLDVPLLVQAGWADRCDRLIVVHCSEEVRRQRLAERHWNREEQEAREAAWNRNYSAATLPSEKLSSVDASRDLAYTEAQVDLIWSGLSG